MNKSKYGEIHKNIIGYNQQVYKHTIRIRDMNKTQNLILPTTENTKISVQTLNNSIKPSIEEVERFILFLNERFKLGIRNDLIVNIQDTSINTKGFFMGKEHKKHYDNTEQALNYICISSLYLNNKPYETIAHELSHYINHIQNHKAKGNYHTKYFKEVAEKLLLEVKKGKYGYNETNETPIFLEMLNDFKPNETAFHIFQNKEDKEKKGSRNILYTCSCGVKIRTAKNEDKPLKAICGYCNTEFIENA